MGYSATALDNRIVSASSVDLGNVLVGYAKSGTSALSTSGDSSHYTNITVDAQSFNSAASTGTHVVSNKSFATSGIQGGSDAASVTGEGLAGEAPVAVSASYHANVFQAAALSTNSVALSKDAPSADLTLTNAASTDVGGQRAGVTVTSLTANNNFSATLADAPSVGNATSSDVTATVGSVNLKSDLLNGSYVSSVTGAAQYTDSALRSQGSVADVNWSVSVSGTVGGQTSSGSTDVKQAFVAAGSSFAGYGLTSGIAGGHSTVATLLSGTTSADATVKMAYVTAAEFTAGSNTDSVHRVADIVSISGMTNLGTGFDGATLTDSFVLQINYTGTGMGFVAWYDATLGSFVNAIAGNSTVAGGMGILEAGVGYGNFMGDMTYNGELTLGNYGYDSAKHVAWAVVDHNSEYTVLGAPESVPEPATWVMMLGGIGVLGCWQRMHRRSNG